jgi:pimeloyl-ACP methyl ester carboxylesterase
MLSALSDLDSLIAEADPPYDGILGFSHGSCLAATLLLRPSLAPTHYSPLVASRAGTPFKVAVFFSAGMAAEHAALQDDEVKMLQQTHSLTSSERADLRTIDIPTAHIFAENDEIAPGQGHLLAGLCSAERRHLATHRLGHRIPGAAERNDLNNAVNVIREAVRDAEAMRRE